MDITTTEVVITETVRNFYVLIIAVTFIMAFIGLLLQKY